MSALSATNVFPDLDPPTSITCLASPVISPVALLWAAVALNKVAVFVVDLDHYSGAIFAGNFRPCKFRDMVFNGF